MLGVEFFDDATALCAGWVAADRRGAGLRRDGVPRIVTDTVRRLELLADLIEIVSLE